MVCCSAFFLTHHNFFYFPKYRCHKDINLKDILKEKVNCKES